MIVIQFCKIGPNFLFCLCSRAMLHFRIKITFSRSNKDFTIYDLSISGTNPTTKLMQTILSHSLQRFVLIYSTLQHWLKFGNGQAEHALDSTSDSVTRVSDSTRITIFGDSDSTRVKLKKCWLESSRVTFFTEWLDSIRVISMTRVRVIFTKSLSLWQRNPGRLHTKKCAFLSSMMIKIGANFLFWLPSSGVQKPECRTGFRLVSCREGTGQHICSPAHPELTWNCPDRPVLPNYNIFSGPWPII